MDFQAGSAVVDMVAIDTERAVREDLGNLASRWHSMEQTVGGNVCDADILSDKVFVWFALPEALQ
jgi:hypothetical protein